MAEAPKPLKSFYSCLDTRFIREVPQPLQHVVIAHFVAQLGGTVVFYTMEDVYSCDSHEVILGKVLEKPRIDGFVFFRIAQFYNGGRPNIEFLRMMLEHGYEVHFAREKISLRTAADLDRVFPLVFTAHFLEGRDDGHAFSLSVPR